MAENDIDHTIVGICIFVIKLTDIVLFIVWILNLKHHDLNPC